MKMKTMVELAFLLNGCPIKLNDGVYTHEAGCTGEIGSRHFSVSLWGEYGGNIRVIEVTGPKGLFGYSGREVDSVKICVEPSVLDVFTAVRTAVKISKNR